jgi:hypothetical protein
MRTSLLMILFTVMLAACATHAPPKQENTGPVFPAYGRI